MWLHKNSPVVAAGKESVVGMQMERAESWQEGVLVPLQLHECRQSSYLGRDFGGMVFKYESLQV